MLHDPKHNRPEETEEEVPAPKPDLVVQCVGCMGSGRTWSHSQRVCRACFGSGSLSLPHQDEPTEDSVWDAAVELLETFGIEKDPEAYAYRQRGDEWIVVSLETVKQEKRQ